MAANIHRSFLTNQKKQGCARLKEGRCNAAAARGVSLLVLFDSMERR
jgi:hypothetical protein